MSVWFDQLHQSDLVSLLQQHKLSIVTALVASPVIYYSVKLTLWIRRNRRKWRTLTANFPGPKKHWLFGNLDVHPGPNEEGLLYHEELTEKYGDSYILWMGPTNPIVETAHPNSVRQAIKLTEEKPMGFDGVYRLIFPWIGDGLLLSSGKKWFRNRRLLTPAFHFDVLRPYMNVYNEAVSTFMTKLHDSSERGEYMEVFGPVGLLTLDIILQCAFSFIDDVQIKGENHPYVNSVKEIAKLFIHRAFHPYLLPDGIFALSPSGRQFDKHVRYAHHVSEMVIKNRKQALLDNPEAGNARYRDFLDILLLARDEDGTGLTDAEIRDEVDTFMFEGHDTTSSAITWILYSLASHPEDQEKCRAEVDLLLKGRDNNYITWEDLQSLPYLTLCIKESLRMYPPVPFVGRQTTKDIELSGRTIPAYTNIDIIIYMVHHNPDVWGKDHNEYRPERFLHENMKDMDSFAFIPFSAGSRNCIGQNFAMHELKVAAARILREFKIAVDPARKPRMAADVVLRPENGMYLKFTARDN